MLKRNSFGTFLIAITLVFSCSSFAQESMQMKDSTKTQMKMHNMSGMKMHNKKSSSLPDSNKVHKGTIDLMAIDKNNDGKIFQCPMELNVISDTKGECPECGMDLREISLPDANSKLVKRGFKVRESVLNNDSKSDDQKNQTSLSIWNKVCPVSGEEVDLETQTVEYKGKVIGFCCSSCISKFKKEPEKYLKNLSDDGTKFIGTK
ncbi:MAG: YHS domain-containing protein [Ignavibacteriales bacterium]|nr:YHS domain-containing protein [Ignavibacteriales bacterium]